MTFEARPPIGNQEELSYHWFHAERSMQPAIAQWMLGMWHLIGEDTPITPKALRMRGWEYLGPVTGRPRSEYLDR